MQNERREFLKRTTWAALGVGLLGWTACSNSGTSEGAKGNESSSEPVVEAATTLFPISLAQWSLHKALQSGEMDPLDFAARAKTEFGISGVEYVTQFFQTRGRDEPYLREMKRRADDHGVQSLVIMVDGEGPLAHPDNNLRQEAIKNHYQWVEAAHLLGCHSIRVNLDGEGSPQDMAGAALDGLATLSDFAKDLQINIIVENHGGNSSNAKWLAGIIGQVKMPNCGTLPDFGNFCIRKENDQCVEAYDRYQGMQELLPFAKAVSAKAYDFDEAGKETTIDFKRMMQMVKDSGYRGHIGVEYEGSRLSEPEGIKATKRLLERVIAEIG